MIFETQPVLQTQMDICQMGLFRSLSIWFSTWPGQSEQVSLLINPNAKSSAITAVICLNWPLVLSLSQSPKHTATDRCEFNQTTPVPH